MARYAIRYEYVLTGTWYIEADSYYDARHQMRYNWKSLFKMNIFSGPEDKADILKFTFKVRKIKPNEEISVNKNRKIISYSEAAKHNINSI